MAGGRVRRTSLAVALAVLGAAAGEARADYIDHLATLGDIGKMKVPHSGRTRVLVIPVIIEDQPFERGDAATFVSEVGTFFSPSATGFSFSGYYEAASLGRFRPEAAVAAPVRFPTCPDLGGYRDCAIPRGGGLTEGDVVGAVSLLQDTLRFLDEIIQCARQGPGGGRTCTAGGGASVAQADASGAQAGVPDGWADGVIIVSNGSFPGIALPVKWLAQHPALQFTWPLLPTFSYDGGVQVGAVAIAGRGSWGSRATYVAVHEFGHLLGWADLYDESGSTTDMPYTVMGGWYYDAAAPLPDPFSRGVIGWANVEEVSGTVTRTLAPASRGGTVLKAGTGEEFFLVEFRTREPALDADLGIPGGVFVERVRLTDMPSSGEGDFLQTLASCPNCSAWDPFLMVEQADGRYDLQSGIARRDADDLFLAGDLIEVSADTSTRSASNPVFSTNRLTGEQTGVSIRVLDVTATSARVEVSAPALGDRCADLSLLCREHACADGYCGDRRPPEPVGLDAGMAPDAEAARADAAVPVDAAFERLDGESLDSADAGGVAPDAAPSIDAPPNAVDESGGCGCGAGGAASLLAALAAIHPLARGRRGNRAERSSMGESALAAEALRTALGGSSSKLEGLARRRKARRDGADPV